MDAGDAAERKEVGDGRYHDCVFAGTAGGTADGDRGQ